MTIPLSAGVIKSHTKIQGIKLDNSLAAVLCKIIKDNERWKFHKKGQGPAKSLISNIPRFGHVFYLINQ